MNNYLRDMARRTNEYYVARTSVLVEDEESQVIIGYHTTLVRSVEVGRVPRTRGGKIPGQEIPMLFLARVAVDEQFKGQGYSKLLMMDVLNRACIIAEQTAIHGIFLDALNERLAETYRRAGFINLNDEPLALFMPIAKAQAILAPPKETT